MKRLHIYILTLIYFLCMPEGVQARTARLSSPDGSIAVGISDNNGGSPSFCVVVDGDTALLPSPVTLRIRGVKEATKIKKVDAERNIKEHIEAPFYRQKEYDTEYNKMTIRFDNGTSMEWRAFDEGITYRYITSEKDSIIIENETANFNFPHDPICYLSYSTNKEKPTAMAFQNQYAVAPLSKSDSQLAFLPATIDTGNGCKLTILEADLEAYPGMFLQADTITGNLSAFFAPYPKAMDYYPWRHQSYVAATEDFIATTEGKRTFPWRVIAITRNDTEMPVNNLVYTLASPSRIGETEWIKPGKVAWDWWNDWGLTGVPFEAGINTDTYKYYIDFASKNGIEYVVLDEGWYDPKTGDMLTVVDAIDLPELLKYGKTKGVDIVLWTVFNVLDNQLEEACKKYSDMGVKGFKVDFLDRDDQTAVEMTYQIAKECAKHNLFLDYHGIYKPTGLQRTYPNVLNFEAVFGMEEVKWGEPDTDFPRYNVTYPFIRNMAGQCDFTPGAMRNATIHDWKAIYSHPMSMGTRANQIANYIINDSPFTMLCDSPSNYEKEEGCVDFIASLPTVFDETQVIMGELGEYIVTARRKGDTWYVGGATNWTPRDLEIPLSMLADSSEYEALILCDGVNAHKSAEDYQLNKVKINRDATKKLHLAPGGGFAMVIKPTK